MEEPSESRGMSCWDDEALDDDELAESEGRKEAADCCGIVAEVCLIAAVDGKLRNFTRSIR